MGSLLGGIFGGGASQASNEAAQAEQAAVNKQNQVIDMLMNQYQTYQQPLLENTVIPQVKARATQTPYYAADWMQKANTIGKPFNLQY